MTPKHRILTFFALCFLLLSTPLSLFAADKITSKKPPQSKKQRRIGPGTDLNRPKPQEVEKGRALQRIDPNAKKVGPGTDLNRIQPDVFSERDLRDAERDRDLNRIDEFPRLKGRKYQPKQKKKKQIIPGHSTIIQNVKGVVFYQNDQDLQDLKESPQGVIFLGTIQPKGLSHLSSKVQSITIGKPLTSDKVNAIIKMTEDFFRTHGYPLTVVKLPKQNIADGVLKLLIVQARFDAVHVYGNKWTSENLLKEYLKLKRDDVIDMYTIERQLHFVNRNPFRQVQASIVPSQRKSGYSDIELYVNESSAVRVYAGGNGEGVKEVGAGRIFSGITVANFLQLDQIFTYQFTSGLNNNTYYAHNIYYTIPLPTQHVIDLFGSYSRVKVENDLMPYTAQTGDALVVSGRYTIPFIPQSSLSSEVTAGIDVKKLDNTIEFVQSSPTFGKNVLVTQGMVGCSFDYQSRFGKTDLDCELFFSPGELFGLQSKGDYNTLRIDARPYYAYGKAALQHRAVLTGGSSFKLRASTQIASSALLASEQSGLGGMYTVRGYDTNEISGDDSFFSSLEYYLPSFQIIVPRTSGTGKYVEDKMQFLAFIDYGVASLKKTLMRSDSGSITSRPTAETILGIGPGMRYQIGSLFTLHSDLGIKLRRKGMGSAPVRMHINAVASF